MKLFMLNGISIPLEHLSEWLQSEVYEAVLEDDSNEPLVFRIYLDIDREEASFVAAKLKDIVATYINKPYIVEVVPAADTRRWDDDKNKESDLIQLYTAYMDSPTILMGIPHGEHILKKFLPKLLKLSVAEEEQRPIQFKLPDDINEIYMLLSERYYKLFSADESADINEEVLGPLLLAMLQEAKTEEFIVVHAGIFAAVYKDSKRNAISEYLKHYGYFIPNSQCCLIWKEMSAALKSANFLESQISRRLQ
jgi:hypothetical protein